MRTIPSGFNDGHITDLHVCWVVTRRDGEIILGTECDQDIEITTGTYAGLYLARAGITGSDVRSTSDLSVDNLEVTGALSQNIEDTSDTSLWLIDLSAADIEAGMFDNAEATTFLVNSANPDLYQRILRTGWLGNVTRGDGQYKTELRGLTQALSQGIVRTYGVGCDAELFDARCKVDPTAFTATGTVDVVTNRRQFQIAAPLGGAFVINPRGRVTWTSGLNTGYSMEWVSYLSLVVTLFLPMPRDIQVGDTFTITQGCDKSMATCINSYANLPNFRGHGVLVPGDSEILKVGKK